MNQLIYGQIQGFLMALESINESGPNDYVGLRFEHVPRVGSLATSLTKHTQTLVRSTSGRDWYGKPALDKIKNWQHQLPPKLNEMFFFLRQSSNTGTVESFMELLTQLFERDDVKVWKLDWFTAEGHSTYPWSVAYPADYVFEHQNDIFQLTLIYSD